MNNTKITILTLARDIMDLLEASPASNSDKVQAAIIAEYWATNEFMNMCHKVRVLSGIQSFPPSREQLQLLAKRERWLQERLDEHPQHSEIQADKPRGECDVPPPLDIDQADNEDFYPRGHSPRG